MKFWDEWRGSLDGRPVMWVKNLISFRGYKLDLHKFCAADDPACFHTHPAKAIRFICWGGYVEELENGVLSQWRPLRVGLVTPSLSHRIHKLMSVYSYSLWLRWPKTHEIHLRGSGWHAATPTEGGCSMSNKAPALESAPKDLIELAEWQLKHFDAVHTHTAEKLVAELKRLTPPTKEPTQ